MMEIIQTLALLSFITLPIIFVAKYEREKNFRLSIIAQDNHETTTYEDVNSQTAIQIDEETKDQKKAIINICFYFIVFFLFVYVIFAVASKIYLSVNGISIDSLVQGSEEYIAIENDLNLIVNIFTYLIAVIGVVIISFKWIKKDLSTMTGKCIGYGFLGLAIMLGVNVIATIILQLFGINDTSTNQSSIEQIMKSDNGLLLMGITTIILAPIVEELVFRKSIFKLFKNKIYLALVVSSLAFGALHVISPALSILLEIFQGNATYTDLIKELFYLIPYSLMGLPFGFVYIKTNKNITTAIIAHMLNNIFSFISIIILPYIEKLLEQYSQFM